jgi:hypothetical protein
MATPIDFIDPRVVQNLEICSRSVRCVLHLGTDIVGRAAQVRKVRPHGIRSAWQKRAIPGMVSREEGINDHDQDYHADQNPIHLNGDCCDAECGGDACQEFFFS